MDNMHNMLDETESLRVPWFSATNVGMIVGATVGSVVGFILLLLLFAAFLMKRRRDNEDDLANEIKCVHGVSAQFMKRSWVIYTEDE